MATATRASAVELLEFEIKGFACVPNVQCRVWSRALDDRRLRSLFGQHQ